MIENEKDQMPFLILFGWLFVLVGWLIAGVYANGAEVQRAGMMVPFVCVGSLLASFGKRMLSWPSTSLVLVIMSYFLIRGWFSPVWDLARQDVILVGVGGLTFFVAQEACRYSVGRVLFLGVAIFLLLGNLAVSGFQFLGNEQFAWLRGERADVKGVSGFYYHRNYLGGFCALIASILVGWSGCQSRRWMMITPLALLSLLMCFLSNSRGGFLAMLIASSVTFIILLVQDAAVSRRILWRIVGGVVPFFIVLVAALFLWQAIIQERGGSVSRDLHARLTMAGVAFEMWQDHIFVGAGGQAFSYEFVRLMDSYSLGGWLGNAVFAHNDFLQLLSDYGILGFGLVLTLIAFLVVRLKPESRQPYVWLAAVACGVLVAEVFRATFDFNLRILPNLMLLALITGGALGQRSLRRCSSWGGWLQFGLFAMMAALLFLVTVRESVESPLWLRAEAAFLRGDVETGEMLQRRYSRKAPEFSLLREVARDDLDKAIGVDTSETWKRAESAWRQVLAVHPKDGETLANLARTLDEQKKFGQSEKFHRRAIFAAGNRENKYGVFYGAAMHWARRGVFARQNRMPGKALYSFQQSEEFLKESYSRNYRRRDLGGPMGKWLEKSIGFLEGARITSEEAPGITLEQVLEEMAQRR